MLLRDVLGFAAVAGLLAIIPGLDTALVLRATATHGRRHGLVTALGVSTGALIWGAGAAVGVAALLTASTIAYVIVRIAGAVYMIWLGAHLLRRAVGKRDQDATRGLEPDSAPQLLGSWTRGLWTNLLNPKIGAFYVAVLPQFIPVHASHLAVGVLLASVHDCECLVWFAAIILGTHFVSGLLHRRTEQRIIDGTTGAALIGLGVKVGLSSR